MTPFMEHTAEAFEDVSNELAFARTKFGPQLGKPIWGLDVTADNVEEHRAMHAGHTWPNILAEEFYEWAQAVENEDAGKAYAEAQQVAAMAIGHMVAIRMRGASAG